MNDYKLHNMLLGVASAATQIEGDCTNTNWYEWYQKGKIKDNSNPNNADKHWQYWKEDSNLMSKMGIKCARIGLEWARIEPRRGCFDEEVLERYKQELIYLNSLNIKPMVTIWHFNNPIWFEDLGGFLYDNAEQEFLKYVKKVVVTLGAYVESWITLNEPNVYGFNSYLGGDWPPGDNSFFRMIKLENVFIRLHIESYKLIHAFYEDALVGTSLHVRAFIPKNEHNFLHKFATKMVKKMFQTSLAKAMNLGKWSFPYRGYKRGKYYDFIGLNYYSRSTCDGFNDGTQEHCNHNDLGWEIYPEGLRENCLEYHDKYQAPIYITENGTCDNNDSFRCKYLYEHFKVIADLNYVERYYHWCFIDNFEWLEGESARFGLVHNNYQTQKRTIKKSGKFYMDLIKNNGVSEKMYKEYVENEKYNLR